MAPPPFRAEHIGSLRRPRYLLDKREQFYAGDCTRQELEEVERRAITDVVAFQRDLGLKAPTSGEFARWMFWDGFHNNLTGMVKIEDPPREIFKMYVPDIKAFFESPASRPGDTFVCKSKLVRGKPMYRPEFELMASLVPEGERKNIKITLAAPEWYHLRHGEHSFPTDVYATDAEYFADLAKAYREELDDLYQAGCRNVQFDDPLLAYFCAVPMLEGMRAEGVDPETVLDSYIKCYADCLRDKPADMVAGIHLCRGNFKDGLHFSEGGYEHISKKLFKQLDNVSTYYLEYDTDRAGTFEPLADLPAPKIAVLGLITSKFPQLESVESLEARIHDAASHLAAGSNGQETPEQALGRLCLSPQCGFASHAEGNAMTDEDVRRKLELVVTVAKKVWPEDA